MFHLLQQLVIKNGPPNPHVHFLSCRILELQRALEAVHGYILFMMFYRDDNGYEYRRGLF